MVLEEAQCLLELVRPDVLGFSLGGGVALRLGIQHPDRVRRLVLVSTPFKRAGWHPEMSAAMDAMGPEVAPFIEYVRASLSEDRKLWTSMFNGKEEYEALISKIADVATRWLERDGKLVMTKVVGGILATK